MKRFHSEKYKAAWTHKGGEIHLYGGGLISLSAEELVQRDTRIRAKYNISPAFRTYGWTVRGFDTYEDYEKELVVTIERVLSSYPEIILNESCQLCGRLKRTPKAQQCMWCLSDEKPKIADANTENTPKLLKPVKINAYERMAKIIHESYKNTISRYPDVRKLALVTDLSPYEFLLKDRNLIRGESMHEAGCEEYAVPRNVIIDGCIEMYKNGADIKEVKEAIISNLVIVKITAEQKRLLNDELGLKSKMPSGWVFNKDDPYARLNMAGIGFSLYENYLI